MSLPVIFASFFTKTQSLLNLAKITQFASRQLASKRICAEDNTPRCAPQNIAKTKCKKELEKKKKENAKENPLKKFFENSGCCIDPCEDALPRFDDLYYKESDKEKRIYRRTWAECPDQLIKKKFICCNDDKLPPINRRKPKAKPQTACKAEPKCPVTNDGCPKIKMPRCKKVRNPPSCSNAPPKPSDCKKRCTPYPSFSECTRDKPKKRHPIECNCIANVSVCEMFAYMRKYKK